MSFPMGEMEKIRSKRPTLTTQNPGNIDNGLDVGGLRTRPGIMILHLLCIPERKDFKFAKAKHRRLRATGSHLYVCWFI